MWIQMRFKYYYLVILVKLIQVRQPYVLLEVRVAIPTLQERVVLPTFHHYLLLPRWAASSARTPRKVYSVLVASRSTIGLDWILQLFKNPNLQTKTDRRTPLQATRVTTSVVQVCLPSSPSLTIYWFSKRKFGSILQATAWIPLRICLIQQLQQK